MGFIPIGIGKYVQLHVKVNPDEIPKELLARLRSCVSDALAGARCSCGAPIWVVGSVSAEYACFTCITGEAFPVEDYEIDQILAARDELTSRGFDHREFESRNGGLKNATRLRLRAGWGLP